MQSNSIEIKSYQTKAIYDFGSALQDLLIPYWVYFPFKALFSVAISLFFPSIFASGEIAYILNDYGIIIPLILGGGIIIFGFPVLVKYFKYVYQMRNTSDKIDDLHFKKANRYEILRLCFMAFMILLVIVFIVLLLQIFNQPSGYYDHYGTYHRNTNAVQIISLGILGILILLILLITKVFSILSLIELNQWIKIQIYADPQNLNLIALESGLNLMKLGCIISFISVPLGDALFNVGIARSGDGFRKIGNLYDINLKSDSLEREKSSSLIPSNHQLGNKSPKKSWNPEKFCQCCGSQRWEDSARFCSNCGEFFKPFHMKK
ncbi:zinc ribbon domain-containing protein [Candidatus Lokiarchaeum ossiferum]|uniref:zinc ribbon domain-containing protein n=1 Tax=Candidatus Lokiarchaeum ossiferum TaxID=2951803 RepID=UPI00352FC84E